MANESTSTNMSLPIPGVGLTDGPLYATDVNSCLTIIDGHNHDPGYGVQVTPSGLNINADLTFQANNLTNARTLRLQPLTSAPALASDIGCIFELNGNLWYNNGGGTGVQLTVGNSIAGATGSITGLVSPASAVYSAGTFTWKSNATTGANMDFASAVLRNNISNSKGLTLQPPAAMGSNYSLTLPPLPSGGTHIVTIDTTGVINSILNVDSTLSLTASVLSIPTNVNIPGTSVQTASKNVIVGMVNEASGIEVSRNNVGALGNAAFGYGTAVRNGAGTGNYDYTFNESYTDTPTVVISPFGVTSARFAVVNTVSTSFCNLRFFDAAGNPQDTAFHIIVMGPRAT